MEQVPLARDTIDHSDLEALAEWVLGGNRLTKGPETLGFEAEFAERIGSRHAVYVNSGSSANLLMVAALKESGRLRNLVAVVPAISWVTTVSPFLQLGFEVELCDADPGDLGLDVAHLRKLLERHRPSVVALVHVLGHPNRLSEIVELCREFDAILIEDACEALGTTVSGGRSVGTVGTAGSYSMYFGHHLSTIEGGIVVTDDDEFHRHLVALRSHGWARDLDPEIRGELAAKHDVDAFRDLYTFYFAGYNLRATDLQAFIGRRQIRRLSAIVAARARIAAQYEAALPEFFRQTSLAERLSPFAYGTLVTDPATVARRLAESGVESRPLICGNIGLHPFWTKRFGVTSLRIADQVHHRGIYLPLHATMTPAETELVISAFRAVAEPYTLR
jgi:CDP-6-deoxy-D-xylo-4-hexulose-3-dehydrase